MASDLKPRTSGSTSDLDVTPLALENYELKENYTQPLPLFIHTYNTTNTSRWKGKERKHIALSEWL